MVVGVLFSFEENRGDDPQQNPGLFLREASQHLLQGLNGGLRTVLRLDSDCLELG